MKQFILTLVLLLPATASACPLCKDAISARDEFDEPTPLPAAFNQSILFMLGVPYSILGIGGFLIYRGVKKNAAILEASKAASRTL